MIPIVWGNFDFAFPSSPLFKYDLTEYDTTHGNILQGSPALSELRVTYISSGISLAAITRETTPSTPPLASPASRA